MYVLAPAARSRKPALGGAALSQLEVGFEVPRGPVGVDELSMHKPSVDLILLTSIRRGGGQSALLRPLDFLSGTSTWPMQPSILIIYFQLR